MQYTFHPHKEIADGSGFNFPIDVFNGTIFLGTLVATPDAFVIKMIDTPKGRQLIKSSPSNSFKTQDIAAKALHKAWKQFRYGGEEPPVREPNPEPVLK